MKPKPWFLLVVPLAALAVLLASAGPLGGAEAGAPDAATSAGGVKVKVTVVTVKGGG